MGPILKTHYDGGHKFTVRKIDRAERIRPEYIVHSWHNGRPVGEYETNNIDDAIETGKRNIENGRRYGIMEESLKEIQDRYDAETAAYDAGQARNRRQPGHKSRQDMVNDMHRSGERVNVADRRGVGRLNEYYPEHPDFPAHEANIQRQLEPYKNTHKIIDMFAMHNVRDTNKGKKSFRTVIKLALKNDPHGNIVQTVPVTTYIKESLMEGKKLEEYYNPNPKPEPYSSGWHHKEWIKAVNANDKEKQRHHMNAGAEARARELNLPMNESVGMSARSYILNHKTDELEGKAREYHEKTKNPKITPAHLTYGGRAHSDAGKNRVMRDGFHDEYKRRTGKTIQFDESYTKIPKVSNLYESYAKVYAQDTLGLDLEESRTSGTRRDSGRGRITSHNFGKIPTYGYTSAGDVISNDDRSVYDYTQTATLPDGKRSKVRHGDVLKNLPGEGKGIMYSAWPVRITGGEGKGGLERVAGYTGQTSDIDKLVGGSDGLKPRHAMRFRQTMEEEILNEFDPVFTPLTIGAIGGLGAAGLTLGSMAISGAIEKRREKVRNRNRRKLEESYDYDDGHPDDVENRRDIARSRMTARDQIQKHADLATDYYRKWTEAEKKYNPTGDRHFKYTKRQLEVLNYFYHKSGHHQEEGRKLYDLHHSSPSRRTPSNWNYQGD
jgi:hypothetical protein